ncbi:MAG: heparinase II/III-family protein [Caldilineaceae bacterium]|nr:heparinase II/III-family protein [Caldilineaceae bacterium]
MFWIKAKTAWRLGLPSLYRYFAYRIGVQSGLNPVRRIRADQPGGPFFRPPATVQSDLGSPAGWIDEANYFGWFPVPLHGKPPQWYQNPFNGRSLIDPARPWWQIPDFDADLGDIKTIWEASRFDWVVAHALQAKAGQEGAIERLNDWLADWLQHNPPYRGPNWKCGQESSIRVMHLALAALLLDQWQQPATSLLDLVRLHLLRIAPTLQYALAQNNNHGTSEAAALFIGGGWLAHCQPDPQARSWEQVGRRLLEDRVHHLVEEDGSFSQYSVNYHRLMLDTLSMAEVWRRTVDAPRFSPRFTRRAWAATQWLHAFTDPQSGDAPNIGANDGARLLPITDHDYRDFRPSVQMAAALFGERHAYRDQAWPQVFSVLGVSAPSEPMASPISQYYDNGGYTLLMGRQARLIVRYPRFKFRPGHGDALHLDLWVRGQNLLRDGGSYSYAAEERWQRYFRGGGGHNTVEFDGREQMPRLGRFLSGAWLQTEERSPIRQQDDHLSFTAAYRDWQGASHRRTVDLGDSQLRVTDQIDGFRHRAILRWRLQPGDWQQTQTGWQRAEFSVIIEAEMPIMRMELVEGWESRYYLQRTSLPVLEIEVVTPGRITTQFSWT